MWGNRYWGVVYWPDSYWGQGADGPAPEPSDDNTRRIYFGMGLHHKPNVNATPLFNLKISDS